MIWDLTTFRHSTNRLVKYVVVNSKPLTPFQSCGDANSRTKNRDSLLKPRFLHLIYPLVSLLILTFFLEAGRFTPSSVIFFHPLCPFRQLEVVVFDKNQISPHVTGRNLSP